MKFADRPYQVRAVERCCASLAEFMKVLLVMATGAGKTITFSRITALAQGRVLIIAHRKELIQQAKDKLEAATGIVAEVDQAEAHASLSARVVVASVQTLAGRFMKYPANHFSLIIVDECHHIMADTYQKPISYFLEGGARVLGVTATPGTTGKKALGRFFEDIADDVGLVELIRAGYLAPIVVKSFPLQGIGEAMERSAHDLGKNLIKSNGEYNEEAVGAALEPYLEDVAGRLGPEIEERKTMIFVPLVKTAEHLADLCRSVGVSANWVCGESKDREKITAGHGLDYQVLINSMLLTEGYDDPGISGMMILRPTHSEILFSQMVGRGTRPFCPWGCNDGTCNHAARKRNLLLLDPLWLHEDMKLVRPANLVCPREDDRKTVAQRVAEAQEQLALLELADAAEHEREVALAERIKKLEKRKAKVIDVEQWAVMSGRPRLAYFEPTMPWHEQPVSDKQADLLLKFGISCDGMNRGQAKQVADSLFGRMRRGLATPRQLKLLYQHKHPSPDSVSKMEAEKWLDARFAALKARRPKKAA